MLELILMQLFLLDHFVTKSVQMNLNTKGQLALKNHWQLYWKKLQ